MFLCYKGSGQLSLHAPVDKFEIVQSDLSQAAKEKTRPNKQRAVTIRQVRVLPSYLAAGRCKPFLLVFVF